MELYLVPGGPRPTVAAGLHGRQARAPIAQPKVVTCSGEAHRSADFWLTALAAYETAATRHSKIPSKEARPADEVEIPTTTAPPKDTALPASSR